VVRETGADAHRFLALATRGVSARQAADYGSELMLTRVEVNVLLDRAREFVAGVRGYLDANLPMPGQ